MLQLVLTLPDRHRRLFIWLGTRLLMKVAAKSLDMLLKCAKETLMNGFRSMTLLLKDPAILVGKQ